MTRSSLRLRLAVALVAAACASAAVVGQDPLRRDADQLKLKIAAINGRGTIPGRVPFRTTVTEQEINAYLAFEAQPVLPNGVVDPSVSILGDSRVTGRAVVDLDRVRGSLNPTSLLDPASYLRGRLMVKATGLVRTTSGVARLDVESADIAGVPIPKFLLQQIVSFYSRTPRRPSGISLDDPFPLPSGIRELVVERGRAVVIQ